MSQFTAHATHCSWNDLDTNLILQYNCIWMFVQCCLKRAWCSETRHPAQNIFREQKLSNHVNIETNIIRIIYKIWLARTVVWMGITATLAPSDTDHWKTENVSSALLNGSGWIGLGWKEFGRRGITIGVPPMASNWRIGSAFSCGASLASNMVAFQMSDMLKAADRVVLNSIKICAMYWYRKMEINNKSEANTQKTGATWYSV